MGGTLFDIIHKRSAAYFFANWRDSKSKARQQVGGGKIVSLGLQSAVVDVLASGEFCNMKRRLAHLLGMYGFVFYVVATIAMVFCYPTPATPTPSYWPFLWWLGALMICVGGYWFWFFIRVDVAAEGQSPFRIMRADLFILSLVISATLGLIWALFADDRLRLVGRGAGSLSDRDHGAVRIDPVVEILAHVLQAGRGARETSIEGQRLGSEFADADA